MSCARSGGCGRITEAARRSGVPCRTRAASGNLWSKATAPHSRRDTLLPVPADGTLGSVRSCDIVVPARGVSPRHLDVMFRNGYGLYIIPWRGCSCIVDGETVASRRDGMAHPLQHNSILEVGQARLRLRVFAGLDVEDVRAYAERREDEDDEQENPQYPD